MIVSPEAGPAPAGPPAGPMPSRRRRRRPPARPAGPDAPGPRPPRKAGVSEKLMARLRRDYGRGRETDDGRALGDLPEVRAWLESLEARRRAGPREPADG